MRNEAQYQFLLMVKKLFELYPNVAALMGTLLQEFYTLLALEGTLVDAVHARDYTKPLAEADHRLDKAVSGLSIAINAAKHLPNDEAAKAAERLELCLKAFRGGIGRKAYEEESAAVKILVAELQGRYAPQINLLGLSVWVTEIATAQAAFENIYLLRNAERAAKPQERTVDVRKRIEALYRQIKWRLEAYSTINGESITGTFMCRLNEEISYFNEHSHHYRNPKDINLTTVDSIDDRTLEEGLVITPLPIVKYKGRELIFAYDYNVTYHNNDRPGNASLIIHGKGAWKDKKTVTFNIIAPDAEQEH